MTTMKHFKIRSEKLDKSYWQQQTQKLKEEALKKQISLEEEEALLEKIRKGNKEDIIRLVESSKALIYSVLEQHPSEKCTVEELFQVGKNQLLNLASDELNSVTRERYFRFRVWCLRKAFQQKEMDI